MAVPDAGTANLSLRGIKDEKENNNYFQTNTFSNISLTTESTTNIETGNPSADRPDQSTPHKMSEFYSYDQDYGGE